MCEREGDTIPAHERLAKNKKSRPPGEIGVVLPNNQRQHRTLHMQKDVLPYTSC